MSDDAHEAMRRAADLADELARAEQAVPVRPHLTPDEAMRALDTAIPAQGLPLDAVAQKLRDLLMATPATATTGFFNQLFGGRDDAATMADMLAPVANVSMYTWKAAGPQILIERRVLRHMLHLAGFNDGEGIFTPGGSLSNLAAMILARNEASPRARDQGLRGERMTVYTSAASHYSIRKAAGLIGIGRANVRKIACDDEGRMRPEALRRAVLDDLDAGARPVFINATAGTTVEGAYDPVDEIGAVAERYGLWLHVDGAYGGSALLSRRSRDLMRGVERADSLTWDAHKMMGVPLTCSVVLTRRAGLFSRHFSEAAEYLFQENQEEFNPGARSLQCGRRNDALKLWAAWQRHGDEGYERRIDHLFELARHLVRRIDADPDMIRVHEPQSINVCFEVRGKSSAEICRRLDLENRLKIGWGRVGDRRTIRFVCVNPDLTEDDLDAALEHIRAVARTLPPGDNAMPPDDETAPRGAAQACCPLEER